MAAAIGAGPVVRQVHREAGPGGLEQRVPYSRPRQPGNMHPHSEAVGAEQVGCWPAATFSMTHGRPLALNRSRVAARSQPVPCWSGCAGSSGPGRAVSRGPRRSRGDSRGRTRTHRVSLDELERVTLLRFDIHADNLEACPVIAHARAARAGVALNHPRPAHSASAASPRTPAAVPGPPTSSRSQSPRRHMQQTAASGVGGVSCRAPGVSHRGGSPGSGGLLLVLPDMDAESIHDLEPAAAVPPDPGLHDNPRTPAIVGDVQGCHLGGG